jgi:hypothetical protein
MPLGPSGGDTIGRVVTFLLWGLVGIAKTIALVLLLTAADTHWRDALAWLALAFGLVAVALRVRPVAR